MKVFIDSADYDIIENALIEFGRTNLSNMEKEKLARIMRKFSTVYSISSTGKISLEPVR